MLCLQKSALWQKMRNTERILGVTLKPCWTCHFPSMSQRDLSWQKQLKRCTGQNKLQTLHIAIHPHQHKNIGSNITTPAKFHVTENLTKGKSNCLVKDKS